MQGNDFSGRKSTFPPSPVLAIPLLLPGTTLLQLPLSTKTRLLPSPPVPPFSPPFFQIEGPEQSPPPLESLHEPFSRLYHNSVPTKAPAPPPAWTGLKGAELFPPPPPPRRRGSSPRRPVPRSANGALAALGRPFRYRSWSH